MNRCRECLRGEMSLSRFVALLIFADCVAQIVSPSPVLSASAALPAPVGQPPAIAPIPETVVISGNPSLIGLPDEWRLPWKPAAPQSCATFHVSAAPSIASLLLYSTGLAHSMLTEVTRNDCQGADNWRDRITLARTDPMAAIDRTIAIKIDSDSLLMPGASMAGSVIALADAKKVAEFTLKVERSPRAEIWTAITWVLTILIPAIIAFIATVAATKLNARLKENDDFRSYRYGQLQQITDFIENDLHPIIGDATIGNRGRLIFDLLQGKKEMLSKSPDRKVRMLMSACIANDVRRVTKILKSLFPEATQSLQA